MKSPDLLHLAGNAMSGFVLTALLISIFAVGDFHSKENFVARAEAQESQEADDDDIDRVSNAADGAELEDDDPDASSGLESLSD